MNSWGLSLSISDAHFGKKEPVTSICKIHNDCDFTVVVREKVDGYLMDLVDAG